MLYEENISSLHYLSESAGKKTFERHNTVEERVPQCSTRTRDVIFMYYTQNDYDHKSKECTKFGFEEKVKKVNIMLNFHLNPKSDFSKVVDLK